MLLHYTLPGVGTFLCKVYRMCCPNGSVFHKKSLDMGPIFTKIPKNGSIFLSKARFFQGS